jgi:RND family efflux transporter MFP subunit
MTTGNTGNTGKRRSTGGVVAVAATIGLAALIGVRVKETLAGREALAAAMAATASAAGGSAKATKSTVRGTKVTWRPAVPVTGTLSPIQQADLAFKIGGALRVVNVKEGARVKTGQPLASLDGAELAAQAAAARAGLRAAEIGVELALDGQRRMDALFAGGTVSESDHVTVGRKAELAKADLERARAQVRLVDTTVGSTTLSAPFAGLVTRVPAGIGKIVGPGEPLFHLEDTSVLKLSATVSENDALLLEPGNAVAIDGNEAAKGTITAVLRSLDPQTRRVPVVAEIPNDGPTPLLAGSFVRATVTSPREIEVLAFPVAVLRKGSQDEVVVVKDGRAHIARVTVTPGKEPAQVYVRDGLSAADEVLLGATSEVREGEAIATGPQAAPNPGATGPQAAPNPGATGPQAAPNPGATGPQAAPNPGDPTPTK